MTKIPQQPSSSDLAELIATADDTEFLDACSTSQRALIVSYIDQYARTKSLTSRQREILEDIVGQVRPSRKRSGFASRRYEGFGGGGGGGR